MPKITKRTVDAARSPSGMDRAYIWDSDVKGFGLMVTSRGTKSYVLQYRTPEGRSRRIKIGHHGSPWTPDEAREQAREMLRDARKGKDPAEAKAQARSAVTVGQLADLYLDEGVAEKPNKKASSWATDRSIIGWHIKPLLGWKMAKALTKADVSRFQADVAAGKSAADKKTKAHGRAIVEGGKGIAARSLAVLSAMLSFAEGRGIIPSNPAKGVRPYQGRPRERFLTDAEVTSIGNALTALEREAALPAVAGAAIRLLLLTGCRRSEILTLRWEHVDFERQCLRLPDSKTGAKVIPLAPPALAILAYLPRKADWVLPATRGNGRYVGLSKHWQIVKAKAEEMAGKEGPLFDGLRIHDLRHSFASFAVMDGGSLYLVGKLLGHKQTRTTEMYAHVADDPLRVTAEIATRRIARAMGLSEVQGSRTSS